MKEAVITAKMPLFSQWVPAIRTSAFTRITNKHIPAETVFNSVLVIPLIDRIYQVAFPIFQPQRCYDSVGCRLSQGNKH